eukprot:2875712-Rhodomonas_salina.3
MRCPVLTSRAVVPAELYGGDEALRELWEKVGNNSETRCCGTLCTENAFDSAGEYCGGRLVRARYRIAYGLRLCYALSGTGVRCAATHSLCDARY